MKTQTYNFFGLLLSCMLLFACSSPLPYPQALRQAEPSVVTNPEDSLTSSRVPDSVFSARYRQMKDSLKRVVKMKTLHLLKYQTDNMEQMVAKKIQRDYEAKIFMSAIFILVGAVVIVSILYGKQQMVHKRLIRLLQLKEEQYKDIKTQLEKSQQPENLNAQLVNIENSKIDQIQESHQLENSAQTQLKESDIYEWFHSEKNWERALSNIEKWNDLRQAIDATYPKFTARLRFLCPQISEQEFQVCYLIKIEIPIKGIAIILHKTTPAITNLRTRLHKKLLNKEGKAGKLDDFILDL